MRRYAHALRRKVTGPVGERLARRHKKGVCLIKRADKAVVAVLRYDDGRQIRTTTPELPQRLGLLSTAASAGVVHRRQMSIRWLTAEGYGRSATTRGAMRESQNRSTA